MAQLATDYMENHGTRFLKQCVPVRIDKADNGLLHVTWKESVTGESHQETFETVLFAIGKSVCKMNFFSNQVKTRKRVEKTLAVVCGPLTLICFH